MTLSLVFDKFIFVLFLGICKLIGAVATLVTELVYVRFLVNE